MEGDPEEDPRLQTRERIIGDSMVILDMSAHLRKLYIVPSYPGITQGVPTCPMFGHLVSQVSTVSSCSGISQDITCPMLGHLVSQVFSVPFRPRISQDVITCPMLGRLVSHVSSVPSCPGMSQHVPS